MDARKWQAKFEEHNDGLRRELRAAPGLERYAELVGHGVYAEEVAQKRETRIREMRGDPVKEK